MIAAFRRAPWQIHLAALFLAWAAAATFVAAFPTISALIYEPAQLMLSNAPALQRFQISLVFLVGCFYVAFMVVWLGSAVALYMGKPWSVFVAVGTLVFVLFGIAHTIWAFPGQHLSILWLRFGILTVLVAVVGNLLLSHAARRHTSHDSTSLPVLLCSGAAVGLGGMLLYYSASKLLLVIRAWILS